MCALLFRRRSALSHALCATAALFWVAVLRPSPAASQTTVPPPSYSTSVHLLLDAPGIAGPDDAFQPSADAILALPHGPYARLGVYTYGLVDMPWTSDIANPVLTTPDAAAVEQMV